MKKVCVFGEPMTGFYPQDNPEIEKASSISMTWGGDASNVAIGVARLGHPSIFFTGVGCDPFGNGFLDLWSKNGVDVSYVVRNPEFRTGLYFVSYIEGAHRLVYWRKNSAASKVSVDDVRTAMLDEASIFLFTGTGLGMGETSQHLCRFLLGQFARRNVPVMFDVNYRISQWGSVEAGKQIVEDLIRDGVSILSVTDDEMETLGWGRDPRHLARMFPALKTVIYKQGPRGALLLEGGRECFSPAFKVRVGDTVGAGDSFNCGYICSLLENKPPEEAIRFSCAVAGLTCRGVGPLEKMPFRQEAEDLLAQAGGGRPGGRPQMEMSK